MSIRLPFEQLVGIAGERFELLANPPNGEPSPVFEGATPDRWAELAGVGSLSTHPAIADLLEELLPVEPYARETVAWRALQRLTLRSVTERVGRRLPLRYRPVIREAHGQ